MEAALQYKAEPCPCGHPTCDAWHVEPVAAIQGVRLTRKQAIAVAELLNRMESDAAIARWIDKFIEDAS